MQSVASLDQSLFEALSALPSPAAVAPDVAGATRQSLREQIAQLQRALAREGSEANRQVGSALSLVRHGAAAPVQRAGGPTCWRAAAGRRQHRHRGHPVSASVVGMRS
ncbi:unnamed protein product [Vitrella brassicaformis CCMP3155]|uniref:Uncharacterized protein n=1 Tax=Vitrella brassicaformis (strain CCMP3155) TaxID=1169540 RepID=A0A0G4GDZ7_VITBC|nr:unnamed protein product [Vitrella brassicaformis CCMP3155]|eukprot:CEM27208.1 unnamed protein product [Vitrella brassicaformis CCMP3155]